MQRVLGQKLASTGAVVVVIVDMASDIVVCSDQGLFADFLLFDGCASTALHRIHPILTR